MVKTRSAPKNKCGFGIAISSGSRTFDPRHYTRTAHHTNSISRARTRFSAPCGSGTSISNRSAITGHYSNKTSRTTIIRRRTRIRTRCGSGASIYYGSISRLKNSGRTILTTSSRSRNPISLRHGVGNSITCRSNADRTANGTTRRNDEVRSRTRVRTRYGSNDKFIRSGSARTRSPNGTTRTQT